MGWDLAAGQAVPLAAPIQPLSAASPASPVRPLSCAVPGTGCEDGEPHACARAVGPSGRLWFVRGVCPGTAVLSAAWWVLGCCRQLGGCGAGGKRGQRPLGNLVGAQSKPCRLHPSQQPKAICRVSCPAYRQCIYPDKSLPRLGHGTGAASSPDGYWETSLPSFSPSPRCCCLLFPVLLLPHGMCICSPVAPSPPPSRSLGDAAVPCRSRGISQGAGEHALAVCKQASKHAPKSPLSCKSSQPWFGLKRIKMLSPVGQ